MEGPNSIETNTALLCVVVGMRNQKQRKKTGFGCDEMTVNKLLDAIFFWKTVLTSYYYYDLFLINYSPNANSPALNKLLVVFPMAEQTTARGRYPNSI
jgi:hypothetical protein